MEYTIAEGYFTKMQHRICIIQLLYHLGSRPHGNSILLAQYPLPEKRAAQDSLLASLCYPIPYPQNQHRIVISTKKNTISCVFQKKAVTLWADLLKTLRY